MFSTSPLWESQSEAPHPFLLEEAILEACLAGRYGPPATAPRPPVPATAQRMTTSSYRQGSLLL